MAVLSLCPSTAPPDAAVWPHPSTLDEESESFTALPLSTCRQIQDPVPSKPFPLEMHCPVDLKE